MTDMQTMDEDINQNKVKNLDWLGFESKDDGEIEIDDQLYWMRVGLHFQRPMQAIMTWGKFVKMRAAPVWDGWPLLILNPNRGPDNCFYHISSYGLISDGLSPSIHRTWKPQPTHLANVPNQGLAGYGTFGAAQQPVYPSVFQTTGEWTTFSSIGLGLGLVDPNQANSITQAQLCGAMQNALVSPNK